DFASETAITARVWHTVIEFHRRAITCRRDKWLLHYESYLLVLHAEVHDLGASVLLDLQHEFQGRLPLCLGDAGQIFPLPLGTGSVTGNVNMPALAVIGDVALDSLPDLWTQLRVSQPVLEILRAPCPVGGGYDIGCQRGAACRVRILVRSYDLPFCASGGD